MTPRFRGRPEVPHSVKCDYCHRDAQRVGAEKLYPHRPDLIGKWFWECEPCGAYVGCHPGTTVPLGRLANAELRRAKQSVHRALDPLWKSGKMKRKEAYAMLAKGLNMGFIYMTPAESDDACALVSSPSSCGRGRGRPAPCPRSGPVPLALSC